MNHNSTILFNCSNIVKGGAIQAVVSFLLQQSRNKTEIQWHYIISKEIHSELDLLKIDLKDSNCLVLSKSPAKCDSSRQSILFFEKTVKPDLVFTFFGPSYIRFNAPEVSGFANGWVTHSTLKVFFETHKSYFKVIKAIAKYIYYAIKVRNSYAWILETETARKGFIKRLQVPIKKTYVVPNTAIEFESDFRKEPNVDVNGHKLKYEDNLFVVMAANYPHKNIKVLIRTAFELKRLHGHGFKIVLTLSDDDFKQQLWPNIKKMDVDDCFLNIGKVDINDIDKVYKVARCSVLPSFIETFSAVYPESFATRTPVITSNRNFAKEICAKAAIYIDPHNAEEIAYAMYSILTDSKKVSELISEGELKKAEMISAEQKYLNYINVLKDVLKILKVRKN